MELQLIQHLGIALGLGLLVGMQRQWSDTRTMGIRTFAMITLFGAIAGILSRDAGGWVIAGGMVALAAIIVMGLTRLRMMDNDPGMTTEVTALVMYGVGALVVTGPVTVAVILGGVVAVLLQWKEPLHSFVRQFGEGDIRAIFQFVLIALVILPLLPDRNYGPYQVLNPFRIWLLVVLIVGISILAFIAQRLVGPRSGALLGGVLGGLISSTATTVSYARQQRATPMPTGLASLVIMIASTIVFVRVTVILGIVTPQILPSILPPIAAMAVVMALIVAVQYVAVRKREAVVATEHAPSGMKPAIIFGALYAVVIMAVAAGREHLGDRGLYLVAAVSGLTDMDAITLSTAELIKENHLKVDTGWRMILIGYLSNMVFKGGIVAMLGNRKLFGYVAMLFSCCLLAGLAILVFWPEVELLPVESLEDLIPVTQEG